MIKLHIHNPNFITYNTPLLVIDLLGGIDLNSTERMVATLRINHKEELPYRTTLDLYSDTQTDKLVRTLCDKYELKLVEVSSCIHYLILELETYRLEHLQFLKSKKKNIFEPTEKDQTQALKTLKSKNLLKQLLLKLNTSGIIGEDDNAIILFIALASHKFNTPFSVLCLAKSGIGKSYLLQQLVQCMPTGSYSFHTRMTSNALYYINSSELHNKALLIEDIDWTEQMLTPLSTLQSQGKLISTRATKNKDGMLHATTFEVVAKLCLVACGYCDKNYQELSLPFLLLHLNHSVEQDQAIMHYQKRLKAGLIKIEAQQQAQHQLKCLIHSLKNVSVLNSYAPLIELPKGIAHPRKSLLLLLNFIEVITFFFQYQRQTVTDKNTGEIFIKTTIEDIELAFRLLKNSLFRRADELSTTVRGFYNWLCSFLEQAKTKEFTALHIRKTKAIHPRTLNRYLQELKLYNYIKIVGGNKHREGYIYKTTGLGNQNHTERDIEQALKLNLEKISKTVSQESVSN